MKKNNFKWCKKGDTKSNLKMNSRISDKYKQNNKNYLKITKKRMKLFIKSRKRFPKIQKKPKNLNK